MRRSSTRGHRLSIFVRGETLARGDAILGLYVEPSGEPYMSFDRGDGGNGTPFADIVEKSKRQRQSYSAVSQFNFRFSVHELQTVGEVGDSF